VVGTEFAQETRKFFVASARDDHPCAEDLGHLHRRHAHGA
jgi:hypothetical protein